MEYNYNIPASQEVAHQIDATFYHLENVTDSVSTENQVVDVQVPFTFCEAITDNESYYHQQQFDDQQVVIAYPNNYPMLSPPIDAPFVNLEAYDLKPIISPEFQHSQIFTPHSPVELTDDHSYGNLNQEIERPDLKIMIPTAEDIKPIVIKSQSFPPSPPTSPPTPHASSNDFSRPRKITSIKVENENVNIVKQEDENNEQDQNELPTYVNPKQYERILKRRIAREKFNKKHNISKERKPYIHQSRHNHAVRRLRGPGGRFLSASETAEMDRRQSLNSTSSSCVSPTTPVSTSTFFNVPEYTYINSNEQYQAITDGYLIGNNDSWNPTLESTSDLCKNDNFPSVITTGNIIESYIQNSNIYESYSEQTPQSVLYLSTPITNNQHFQEYY